MVSGWECGRIRERAWKRRDPLGMRCRQRLLVQLELAPLPGIREETVVRTPRSVT